MVIPRKLPAYTPRPKTAAVAWATHRRTGIRAAPEEAFRRLARVNLVEHGRNPTGLRKACARGFGLVTPSASPPLN